MTLAQSFNATWIKEYIWQIWVFEIPVDTLCERLHAKNASKKLEVSFFENVQWKEPKKLLYANSVSYLISLNNFFS